MSRALIGGAGCRLQAEMRACEWVEATTPYAAIWKAQKATSKGEFDRLMKEVADTAPGAARFLRDARKEDWATHRSAELTRNRFVMQVTPACEVAFAHIFHAYMRT